MNFCFFRSLKTVCQFTTNIVSPLIIRIGCNRTIHNTFHPNSLFFNMYSPNIVKPIDFSRPVFPQFIQVCGMKVKGQLQLRCKGCYYVSRLGRLYVMCRLKPRHKQMQMIKSFRNRQILTFASQKKVRDW